MRIALNGCLEIGDIVFDSIIFANMLKADHNTVTNALRSTWVCFFVVACVLSVLNLYLKIKLFIECLRHRDRQEEHETGSKLAKHNQRLHATTRHIKGILSGMMIALGESMLRFCSLSHNYLGHTYLSHNYVSHVGLSTGLIGRLADGNPPAHKSQSHK